MAHLLEDAIYNLDYKRDEVNQLHKTAVDLKNSIDSQLSVFNSALQQYNSLIAGNSALVIITNILTFTDLQMKDFNVSVSAVQQPPVGFLPVSVASMITEGAGGIMMLKAVRNIGKLLKDNILGKSAALPEAVAESETETLVQAGVEAGIEVPAEATVELTAETLGEGVTEATAETALEGASLAGLGGLGIGIIAAVGIDAIFSAINGYQEQSQLDSAISNLNSAIAKCNTYLNTIQSKQAKLDASIIAEEKRFIGIVDAIAKVASTPAINNSPKFQYKFDTTTKNSGQFIEAIRSALSQYGPFSKLRNDWAVAETKTPRPTKSEFLKAEAYTSPLSEATLQSYFDILRIYSDSMAKVANT